jgi:membrane protein YqaA with SNARE-associated domain
MKNQKKNKILIQIIGIILLVVVIIWINQYATEHELIKEVARKFGYIGVFFGAAISGFNLIVPIPIITFLPFFIEIGLNTAVLIAIIAVGMTFGDAIGYLIGRTGRDVISNKKGKLFIRIQTLKKRHEFLPYILLFIYASFAPIPNEPLVIPMALLGFKFKYMFIALLLGNLVFNSLAGTSIITIFEFF